MNERRTALEIKLAANSQRRARERYLCAMEGPIAEYLQACPFLLTPVLDEMLPNFSVWPAGVGRPRSKPPGYSLQRFGWAHNLLARAASIGSDYDDREAVFWPYLGNPMYVVKFGWARQNIVPLFESEHHSDDTGPTDEPFRPEAFGVVTMDGTAGIVIGRYLECLIDYPDFGDVTYVDGPNPDEHVRELVTWG